MLKNTLPKLAVVTTGVITIGVVQVTFNSVAKADDFMNTYFRDGQVIKLVTPKGYNVNLPYATNGGMINTFEPDGTDDWKFVVVRTTNGVKFKKLNTNHIITSQKFSSYNLAPLEAYNDVGGEDKYQTWIPIPSKSGFFNICLLAQQDQCMNVPRSTNRTKLTTYQRDLNDQDQWFSAVDLSPSSGGANQNRSGNTPYLPFDPGVTLRVTQGNFDSDTHNQSFFSGFNNYAVDFGVDGRRINARSVRKGKVVNAELKGDYGNVVVIQYDDGKFGHYEHLAQIYVKVGEYVPGGRAVGLIGSTGNSYGPHLHYHESLGAFQPSVPLPNFVEGLVPKRNITITSANQDNRN